MYNNSANNEHLLKTPKYHAYLTTQRDTSSTITNTKIDLEIGQGTN